MLTLLDKDCLAGTCGIVGSDVPTQPKGSRKLLLKYILSSTLKK